MLEEFEGMRDSWSTTIVQLDGRYPEKRETEANKKTANIENRIDQYQY